MRIRLRRGFKNDIFDWRTAIEPMQANLMILRKHLMEHDHIMPVGRIVDEIEYANGLWESSVNAESFEDEDRLFREYWNYLRDHIQGWWD